MMVSNRLFRAVLLLILLTPLPGLAQRSIGVVWDSPADTARAAAQLEQYSTLGVTHLQVTGMPLPQTWNHIERRAFTVYGMLPVTFPIEQTFSRADSAFTDRMAQILADYSQQPSVGGVGIFSYPGRADSAFRQAVRRFRARMPAAAEPIYYTGTSTALAADTLFDFVMVSYPAAHVNEPGAFSDSAAGAFLFRPDPGHPLRLMPVKRFLEQTASRPSVPVFFSGAWLQQMIQTHPGFASILSSYATSADAVFPLPAEEAATPFNVNSIIAILLLLVWALFGITYNYNPVYRKSLQRYFTGHTFFIQDIMERHIRYYFPGTSILLQHCITGGIVLFCLFHITISPLGYQALQYHYPAVAALGSAPWAVLLWGMIFTFVLEMICILWLWATNSGITHLSQVINLYPWPLQVNLLIATFIAAFFFAGGNDIAIYLLTAFFALIFLSTFLITAFDTARYESKRPRLFLAGTVGLYLVLIASVTIWIAVSPALRNVMQLAVELP